MKRQLNIIIGNLDDDINDFISKTIEIVAVKNYRLNIKSFFDIEDIEDYAERYPIDLFVIVINNVNFYENLSANNTIEKALQFLRKLKNTHNRPIIALYAWPDDPLFPERTKQVGANFCLEMPCKSKDLQEAVQL